MANLSVAHNAYRPTSDRSRSGLEGVIAGLEGVIDGVSLMPASLAGRQGLSSPMIPVEMKVSPPIAFNSGDGSWVANFGWHLIPRRTAALPVLVEVAGRRPPQEASALSCSSLSFTE